MRVCVCVFTKVTGGGHSVYTDMYVLVVRPSKISHHPGRKKIRKTEVLFFMQCCDLGVV